MIDLKEIYGKQVKVMLEPSWEGGEKVNHWKIQGKRGDVMAWDDQWLEVTIYGKILKIKQVTLADKTHNLKLADRLESEGWKAKNHYDDSTCFLVPKDQASKVFEVIKARKRRHLSPEQRQRSIERFARMRSSVLKANENGGLET